MQHRYDVLTVVACTLRTWQPRPPALRCSDKTQGLAELLRKRLVCAGDERDKGSVLGVLAHLPDAVRSLLKVHVSWDLDCQCFAAQT